MPLDYTVVKLGNFAYLSCLIFIDFEEIECQGFSALWIIILSGK